LAEAEALSKWELVTDRRTPELKLTTPDGTQYVGRFTLKGKKVTHAEAEVIPVDKADPE
jgi:hypothetical protein